nr:cytochrome P450 71A4-like [Tanacetum cinerariifolium]
MMMIFPSLETFVVSLFSFIILITLYGFRQYISLHSNTKKTLPPSPPKLPIIGNLHQLGSSPHRSLRAISQKYGPLMLIHLGNVPTLVASSAEAAQEIMKTHDISFSNRPILTMATILFYDYKDIIFSPYGEYWRQLKSIVVVHLLSNTRVKSFSRVREKEISHMISVIGESCGSVVDLSALFDSLTNNVICRVALGRTYPGLNFKHLLTDLVNIVGSLCVGDYFPWLSFLDRLSGLKGRAQRLAKKLDDFFQSVVEEHQNKRIRENFESDQSPDLVDILLDVQKHNSTGFVIDTKTLKAVILDIFGAGTDTLSTSIDWIMCELVRHPRVMKKLQQEVTEVAQGRYTILEEDLEKMKYLKAVIKEALRLHPPNPLLVPRESTQEIRLMGYDIPKGTQVMINAWAIGRDPTLWEKPEEFWPERFLNNSIDYKGINFEWLPFGGGRRGCPGIYFSAVLMELALANVVYKFDLVLPNGVDEKDMDMSEANGFTIHRKSSLVVTASPSVPTLVASSAEAAREIMKSHDVSFSNRPSLTMPTILFYGCKDIAFSPYGEHWRQLKSIVVLHLLSNTRVKSFSHVREQEISHMISVIGENCGSVVDLSVLFASLTNNIICRVALGRTYPGLNFKYLLTNLGHIVGSFSVGDYFPWLSLFDRISGLKGRAQKLAKEIDAFLQSVVEEHQTKRIGENAKSDEGQDLVDILLDVQNDNATGFLLDIKTLKAVILDIFGAGTDTLSTSLDWTMCELVRHPRVMRKLQQEVEEIAQGRPFILEEDLEKLKYLKAVIKEGLRLHPPNPLLVPHESTKEVKLMGYDIPKGTQVVTNVWAIGRDTGLWEKPEEFWPERFLNNSIDYKGVNFEWLPFGGGRRGCPGIQFSVVIMELALANVVYKFDFLLPNGVKEKDMDMSEANGITIHRKSSLVVRASPRF